ncbi:hypothetical protein MH928_13510 [Flavobacterium sp. WW92]|uniref:hypothetical protein n=1 Tax=Flavobacterium sp. WW92 TaxID=1454066 RepID=UPI002378E75D|nr:hypothetical protein [Flavobacterium sp. WW92]WDO12337.1 hypothetical protein MH928_13510 [Flavobacterium sp. WW92]
MPVKSGSGPLSRNLASLLLLFLNILGLILIWELLSVDEMIRYQGNGGITSCEFRAQTLVLLAIATTNLSASLIALLACYYRPPPRY